MPSRNDITGDLQQTRYSSSLIKKLESEGDLMSIQQRRKNRGKFVWCSETRKFITKTYQRKVSKSPMVICNHFEPFENMIDGTIIRNKKEHQYDLEKNNARVYEGRSREQKEVNRHLRCEDQKFEKDIRDSVDETAWQIEHNYSRPEYSGSVNFDMVGEDE